MAIARTAEVLRQTFRNSDIVSRIGGDEFAILAQNVPLHEVENITARREENLRTKNQTNKHGYQLSLSVGAVWIAHDNTLSMDQLVENADQAMYDQKRSKKALFNAIVHASLKSNEDLPPSRADELRLTVDAV